jgi:hypothetical protein
VSTVVDLETRRRGWADPRTVPADWVIRYSCPWCRGRHTVEAADALGPIEPECGGPPLTIAAVRLPGAEF